MELKKIGVVGIGTMGHGIAQINAVAKYDVVVVDATDSLLSAGMNRISGSLDRVVKKGTITEADKTAIMGRIKTTTKYEDLADCDMVIEAVFENLDLKKQIFQQLDKACKKPECILATNTSCLSVMDLAVQTKRPQYVLGTHFFVPAQVMKLLEIVKTIVTRDDALDTVKKWGAGLEKVVVVAKDTPGFIANALTNPFLLDAVRMLENGIATRDDIDNAIKFGMNHPMGPLQLIDFSGCDVVKFVADSMYAQTKDPKWAAPILLTRMVTAGYFGQKSGKGFYDYPKK